MTISEESFGILPLEHKDDVYRIFLIQHKDGHHWGFPKGRPDAEETPIESAIRELEEETGLKVEKLLYDDPLIETYSFERRGEKVDKTVFFFPALVSGAFLLQPEEIVDGGWFTFAQAEKKLTFLEAKRTLNELKILLKHV